jgi:hypothetical protein
MIATLESQPAKRAINGIFIRHHLYIKSNQPWPLPFPLRTKKQAFFRFLALVNSFFVEIASFLNLSLTSFIGLSQQFSQLAEIPRICHPQMKHVDDYFC